jgi:hypothetical protein
VCSPDDIVDAMQYLVRPRVVAPLCIRFALEGV